MIEGVTVDFEYEPTDEEVNTFAEFLRGHALVKEVRLGHHAPRKEPLRIENLEHLKELASQEDPLECYILLSGGVRSSKIIHHDKSANVWSIVHEIDGSEDTEIDTSSLWSDTNIGEALDKGALFQRR